MDVDDLDVPTHRQLLFASLLTVGRVLSNRHLPYLLVPVRRALQARSTAIMEGQNQNDELYPIAVLIDELKVTAKEERGIRRY